MSAALTTTFTPDMVVSFSLRPGTFGQFLGARAEGGPRLKCFEGSVTLVSPGKSHETTAERLTLLVLAVGLELGIKLKALRSTTQSLPDETKATAYEPDQSYYVQSLGTADEHQVPDLAVEIVVSHHARKAILAAAALGIPELWVLDLPRHELTFYHLAMRGKSKGTYLPRATSRAFPLLRSAEALERLDDPEADDTAFHETCRAWARNVLAPRRSRRGRRAI